MATFPKTADGLEAADPYAKGCGPNPREPIGLDVLRQPEDRASRIYEANRKREAKPFCNAERTCLFASLRRTKGRPAIADKCPAIADEPESIATVPWRDEANKKWGRRDEFGVPEDGIPSEIGAINRRMIDVIGDFGSILPTICGVKDEVPSAQRS
jgi:hypothetical protein